jgi:hypothetical protein
MLTAVVVDAALKQPNADLDDVIRAYLHAELDRQKVSEKKKNRSLPSSSTPVHPAQQPAESDTQHAHAQCQNPD